MLRPGSEGGEGRLRGSLAKEGVLSIAKNWEKKVVFLSLFFGVGSTLPRSGVVCDLVSSPRGVGRGEGRGRNGEHSGAGGRGQGAGDRPGVRPGKAHPGKRQ